MCLLQSRLHGLHQLVVGTIQKSTPLILCGTPALTSNAESWIKQQCTDHQFFRYPMHLYVPSDTDVTYKRTQLSVLLMTTIPYQQMVCS